MTFHIILIVFTGEYWKMYDLQRIGKVISDIEKYTKEIEGFGIKDAKDLKDIKTLRATSMDLFAILDRLIDLGNEIISAESLGAPNTYQDIMPILAKAGIMNKAQADKLNELVKKRNLLAHFYEEIREKELMEIIKSLPEVNLFVLLIKKRVMKK